VGLRVGRLREIFEGLREGGYARLRVPRPMSSFLPTSVGVCGFSFGVPGRAVSRSGLAVSDSGLHCVPGLRF